MTLQEFFNFLSDKPFYLLVFFLFVPLTALIAGIIGKNEGHLSPWKYLYAVLVYLICIPGIFSLALNGYLFLFERRSILQTDLYTQILPVFSMAVTLFLIRRNVSLDNVPGFGRLSGLFMLIIASLFVMYLLDRTRIFLVGFFRMPAVAVFGVFAGILLLLSLGWSRFTRKS